MKIKEIEVPDEAVKKALQQLRLRAMLGNADLVEKLLFLILTESKEREEYEKLQGSES